MGRFSILAELGSGPFSVRAMAMTAYTSSGTASRIVTTLLTDLLDMGPSSMHTMNVLLPVPGRPRSPSRLLTALVSLELWVAVFASQGRVSFDGIVCTRRPIATCVLLDTIVEIKDFIPLRSTYLGAPGRGLRASSSCTVPSLWVHQLIFC